MLLLGSSQDLTRAENVGGLTTHVRLLRSALESSHIPYQLLTGIGGWENWKKAWSAVKSVVRGRPTDHSWLADRIRFLQQLNTGNEFKLIHAHDVVSAAAFSPLSAPLILTVHGPFAEECAALGRRESFIQQASNLEKEVFARADRLIAVDEGQGEILLKKGVPSDKIRVISNAVDIESLQRLAKMECSVELPERFFVLTRRLVEKNGVIFAVNAFLAWVGDRPIHLVVVGDGPARVGIEDSLRNHPKGARVILLGSRSQSEVIPILSRSRASLVPSVPLAGVIEATSLSVLESLALGIPVIGSEIGGIREIGVNCGGVLFVAPGCIPDIENALQSIDSNEFTVPARTLVTLREKYGVHNWFSRILEIYRELGFASLETLTS